MTWDWKKNYQETTDDRYDPIHSRLEITDNKQTLYIINRVDNWGQTTDKGRQRTDTIPYNVFTTMNNRKQTDKIHSLVERSTCAIRQTRYDGRQNDPTHSPLDITDDWFCTFMNGLPRPGQMTENRQGTTDMIPYIQDWRLLITDRPCTSQMKRTLVPDDRQGGGQPY